MDCISFVYDYQLNIREISELGQGMRFSCFSSPLLGLGLDATLPIKSALFSMIQKPRDTSIYAILHTSIHFYAPLYTSIFNIVLSICYILLIFAAVPQLFVEVFNLAGVKKISFVFQGHKKHGETEHFHDHQ